MAGSIGLSRKRRTCPQSPWTDRAHRACADAMVARRDRPRDRPRNWAAASAAARCWEKFVGWASPPCRRSAAGATRARGRGNPPRAGALARISKSSTGARARDRPPPAWVAAAEPYVDDPLTDAGIPFSQRRSLLELSERTCRWPVGDPGSAAFFYCGAEPVAGKPYCAAHCARAYRPPDDATPRRPSARRRRAMLRYLGIWT